MVKKTLPGAPAAEAMAKFKKAYPSAAAMGNGFPAFGADALRFTLSTFPPSNKRIALAPKQAVRGLVLFLQPALDYYGKVVDAHGAPVADAHVKMADAPKSFADLLNPKWAGKMVKAHPASLSRMTR